MPITKILSPSVDYATRAVEAAYVCVAHTDCDADIRSLPGFLPVAQYGQRTPLHETEIGSVENVRFLTSPDLGPFLDAGGAFAGSGTAMVTTSGTSADVYPYLFFGKEAFGCVALRGMGAVEPTIIRPGVKDKSDPLGQRGYIGWKTWFACLILNDVWMAREEAAVTAL
jgi:N4-gp56 family major capsid protein